MELLLLGFTILSYMTYRVKEIPYFCDSKGIVSPITAKVKCPHQGGSANDGRHCDE